MSVSNLQSSTGALVGNNSTTTGYVVSFPFAATSDLVVVRKDSNGNLYTLNPSTDYTVIQNPDFSGGTIYTTTKWDSTNQIVINRVVSLTQLLTLLPGAKEPSAAITAAFDKLTYICQQLARNSAPDSSTAIGTGPYVLGLNAFGGIPAWVPQSAANLAYGSIAPAYLSAGAPTWDLAGNLTVIGSIVSSRFVGALLGNAASATTAAACSGNAATATTAAACSGNAATATTAASCSGNAATASAPAANSALSKACCKAWVNFDGTTTSGWPGGTSTVSRLSGTTTATVTTANAHGLVVGNQVYAASGVVAGTYTITAVPTPTSFTFTTVANTALNANPITFNACTIRAGYNVNLVTRSGTGLYLVNFLTPMADVNYSANVSVNSANAVFMTQDNAFYTNGLQISCTYYNASTTQAVDQTTVCAQIFGN
jgi:hypothetical protein